MPNSQGFPGVNFLAERFQGGPEVFHRFKRPCENSGPGVTGWAGQVTGAVDPLGRCFCFFFGGFFRVDTFQ